MYFNFQSLFSAGFQHLHPIIPHDATISSYSKSLHGEHGQAALGKNPGKLLSDGWVGFYEWQKHVADPDLAAQWDDWNAGGIGLRCHDVVAVDIDVLDEDLGDLIVAEAMTWLGFGPTRIGNWPKRLMLFRLAEPGSWPSKQVLRFDDWRGQSHAVELLGALQQFVVAGIHPKTHQPYRWDEDLVALGMEGLPEVDNDDLQRFLAECHATLAVFDCDCEVATQAGHDTRSAEDLMAADLDVVRRAVDVLPNDEDTDRERFVAVAHALHGATGGSDEGLALFDQWADKWPEGQREGEVERVYQSAHGTSLGVQWLLDEARKHGMDSTGDDFEGAVVDNDDSEDAADDSEDENSLWGRWVYVNRMKRFVDRRNNTLLDKEQFNDTYMELGDGERPDKFFLLHRRPGCWADDVDYRPGDHRRVTYDRQRRLHTCNMWVPGPAQDEWLAGWTPDDGVDEDDLRPWLELGEHLFPDAKEREILIQWMASLLQRPGEKPNWHPLVGSETHGTGKDSWFAPLVHGLGTNVNTIKTQDLEGQWTWWAENKQLVVVSEVNSFERRSVMNRLKSYMAAPPFTIEINKKGVPQYEVPNLFGMVMFTNNPDAVAIEQTDRRFFVMWSDAGVLADSFYRRYHQWLENGGALAVSRYLMTVDLSDFSAKGNAPFTHAKENMRKAALPLVEGLLEHAIESEEGPFSADVVTVAQVRDWLKSQTSRMPSPHKLGVILRQVGARHLGRALVSEDEGRQRLYAVRRVALYAQLDAGEARDRMVEQRNREDGALADFG